jgi:hypothetical protein
MTQRGLMVTSRTGFESGRGEMGHMDEGDVMNMKPIEDLD